MKLKTTLSKLRHDGYITDAEYSIIINALNKFSTQPPKTQQKVEQPCDDAISREAIYEALSEWDEQDVYLPYHFKELVAELPSVTPWSGWIPATQLPEPNMAVLLHVKYKSKRSMDVSARHVG